MPGISPDPPSADEIAFFLQEHEIDAFCIAGTATIRAPAGRHPRDILPGCRTIIIFGSVMPDRFFSGTEPEQARETKNLKERLEGSALGLRDLLIESGAASEAILPSLPLKVEDGLLRGRLSFKHCAADAGFGTIGWNSLLIHPVYGNRLALAAVLTEQSLAPSPHPAGPLPACTRCNRCVTACTPGAIHDGTVEITRCRNLADYVPRPLRPISWRLMRGRWSARFLTMLLHAAAQRIEIRATCTACMTACPYFHKEQR